MDTEVLLAIVIAFFILALIEMFLLWRWNHIYFRNGVIVFKATRNIPAGSWKGPDLDEVHATILKRQDRWIEFHRFSDTQFGFREAIKKSFVRRKDNSSMLRGYVYADLYVGRMSVYGRLNFVALALPFLFVFFFTIRNASEEGALSSSLMPWFFAAVFVVIYGIQYVKFRKLANLVADEFAGTSEIHRNALR